MPFEIRPLKWVHIDERQWCATTVFGDIWIHVSLRGAWHWKAGREKAAADSLDAAKAAASAWYMAKMREGLVEL